MTAPMKAAIMREWPKLSATLAPAATAMESASASSQSMTHWWGSSRCTVAKTRIAGKVDKIMKLGASI